MPRTQLGPWAIALTSAVIVAVVGAGAARWFGVGVAAGLLASAACAWVTLRGLVAGLVATHEKRIAGMADEGDARVETVIRQFEWAVRDVVRLKADTERAEAAADALVDRARHRERYVERLERELFAARERLADVAVKAHEDEIVRIVEVTPAPDIVPFRWALHNDGYRTNLELESAVSAHRPTRVRVVDADGEIVLTSGTPMRHPDGAVGFTLARPPVELVLDLDAGREGAFHLEALVDGEWLDVSLEDSGRRTKVTYDKQGRLYRVSDDPEAAKLLAPSRHEPKLADVSAEPADPCAQEPDACADASVDVPLVRERPDAVDERVA